MMENQKASYRQTAWILVVGGIVGIFASIELIIQKDQIVGNTNFKKGEAYYIPFIKEEKKKYTWEEMVNNFLLLHQQIQ